ncbi:MAG TPA: ABC transporter substrate-binding protein [Phenylobacterium sp.]|nr:ABC transporter substrate-binding protein [Phenylobacterium sp.]
MKPLKFLGLALALVLAACSQPAEKAEEPAPGRTKIVFATDWVAQAELGGFYQALATGEYAKRGLDVTIRPGGAGSNVPQLLASGAVDMGVGSNSFIVMNMVQEGVPVTAVAAIMQKDPQVLIAHPGQGVEKLADLKGRPILLSDGSITAFWVWLKAKYGFTDDQVRKYTFNSAPFLADKRSAQQGYVTSEPYTLEKTAGLKPVVFLLADNGYPGYATMILAGDKLLKENPAAVRAFVEASAAGWKSYLHGDAAPGDALIRKDNPEMPQDVLDQAREKMVRYGLVDGGEAAAAGVGVMNDARWAEFFQMAADQGIYPKDMDYRQAYSLEFVGKP